LLLHHEQKAPKKVKFTKPQGSKKKVSKGRNEEMKTKTKVERRDPMQLLAHDKNTLYCSRTSEIG